MKRLPFLILIVASILVCGCHRHDAFFQSVEDLIDSAPDSALALAEAFEPFGRAEKARRILLITKAKSKAYIDIADDSIIETAVDYYRGRNDSLEVQALLQRRPTHRPQRTRQSSRPFAHCRRKSRANQSQLLSRHDSASGVYLLP